MLSEEQKSKKLITTLSVFIAVAVVAWIILLSISYNKFNANKDLEIQVANLEAKKDNLLSLRSQSSSTKDDRAVLASYFVNSDTKADFIGKIEDLARGSRVTFVLNAASEDSGVSFDFTVAGAFPDVYHFLQLMENLPSRVSVEKLSLLSSPVKKGGSSWSANFIIKLVNYN